jgi:hypothetical protein
MDYSCVLCNRSFGRKGALEQHERDSPVHKKAINYKTFDPDSGSGEALDEQKQNSSVHKKAYHCETCNRSFGSREALDKHKQNSPVHKQPFHCEICSRYFGSREALEQHEQNSPAHKQTFCCETCNRYFGTREALAEHEQNSTVHKGTFQCENCDYYFGSRKGLKSHTWYCQGTRRDEPVSSPPQATYPTLDMLISLIIQRHSWTLASMNQATISALAETLRTTILWPTQETREFFLFPTLHPNIAKAVAPEIPSTWFQEDDDDDNFDDDYFTHVMGIFICANTYCKTQLWVSKKVSIEMREYDDNGYCAIVYNERCMSCNGLGTFVLDQDSYVDRVAYRLKKWAGVVMPLPYYNPDRRGEHARAFCEGCKRGKCRQTY